jgi:hypothetical protein
MSAAAQTDWFAQNAPPAATSGDWFDQNAPKAATAQPSAADRLKSNFLSSLGITDDAGAKQFFAHPIDTLMRSLEAQGDLAKKARDAYDKGDYMGAVVHGLNYLVPFTGQQTDQAGQQLQSGDIAGGIGRTLGTAVPALLSPEGRAAVSNTASAISERAGNVATAARNVTPKQASAIVGGAAGAYGGGHIPGLGGAPGPLGAVIGAERGAALAEKVLGEERANAPIFPRRAAATEAASEATPAAEAAPAKLPAAFQGPGATYQGPSGTAENPVRTVITDPVTGKPEFSDVVAAKQTAQPTPAATPANVEQALNQSLGGQPLVRGVSLRNQPTAQAVAAGKLPEGFTPVDSSVLKGYKYDPATQRFSAILKNGQSYVHGEVTPDLVSAFEAADSKGAAWTKAIRNGPGTVLVEKNGVAVKPATMASESGEIMPKARAGMNEPETESYIQPLQQMLDDVLNPKAGAQGTATRPVSLVTRLVKGEAGQAGLPGSVTDADEGIADIQNRPVLATKTGQVPARGFLNTVGADENSVLKTQSDLDSVFYHRQQIAKNGPPDVELHVDEGGDIIGAQGRHRALAAVQQGGRDAKVNVTIYKHPFQAQPAE